MPMLPAWKLWQCVTLRIYYRYILYCLWLSRTLDWQEAVCAACVWEFTSRWPEQGCSGSFVWPCCLACLLQAPNAYWHNSRSLWKNDTNPWSLNTSICETGLFIIWYSGTPSRRDCVHLTGSQACQWKQPEPFPKASQDHSTKISTSWHISYMPWEIIQVPYAFFDPGSIFFLFFTYSGW